jgi:tetratricopeptide (TPR) repeat protein
MNWWNMQRLTWLLMLLAAFSVIGMRPSTCTAAGFADRVRLVRGSETGEVTTTTPFEVTVTKSASNERKIPVNEIKAIVFDGEPAELSQARTSVANGAFAKALQQLEKIDLSQVRRDLIKQDIEYYQALAAARLAEGGEGEVIDAGRKLNSFVRSYPTSHHFLDASEMMGDLLMVSGRYEPAQRQYAELAKAPWSDYKMRAAVALGRSLQAQGKQPEAIAHFDSVLAMADEGPDAANQKLAATLGRAISLAESGKTDESVGAIEKVILDTDTQEKQLQARAHNALGKCYEKAGRSKDALFAYLYVDIIYNTVPDAHAESLFHLVPLWRTIGQDDRSRETREVLLKRYPGSRWAKQLN